MRQIITAAIIALGVALFVGGVCALVYGLTHRGPTFVAGLGPLNGLWAAENYCFLGAVLAAIGGGLATFGLLVRSPGAGAQQPTRGPRWGGEPEDGEPARDLGAASPEAIRRRLSR